MLELLYRFKNNFSHLLVFLAALVLLSGCYESTIPAFDDSESDSLPKSGVFVCSLLGMAPARLSIREEAEGFIWKKYRYHIKFNDDPEDVVIFKKIDNDMYVGQGKAKSGNYSYLFLIFTGGGRIILASGSPMARGMAKSYGVQVIQHGEKFIMKGERAALRKFLLNHSPDMVVKLAECRPER